jgi:type I restriction enzyme, S subunit
MSRIDDLIAHLAPEGVPLVPLGETGEFIRGNGLQKGDLTAEGSGAIHYGQIHTLYGTWTTATKSFVKPELALKLRRAKTGDLVIATTSEDDAAVAKATAWLGDDEIAVSGDAYIFRHRLDPKYVAYFFQSEQFQQQKLRHITGTKVRRISGRLLGTILIPVPPLSVQTEIASLLDAFARLQMELKMQLDAELVARNKQYSFYRDSFLASPPGARPFALGEIAEFKYGYTATAQLEGDYRFLRITDINTAGKLSITGAKYVARGGGAEDYLVRPGDLLMARTGATFGKTMLVGDIEPSVYASFLIRIRLDETIMLPSYYWHYAQSDLYWSQANSMVSTGGQPQFNANVLKLIEVPVPPLEDQARTVELLDRFDRMTSGLSTDLASEVVDRRKQYEHFRERLFAFPEVAA